MKALQNLIPNSNKVGVCVYVCVCVFVFSHEFLRSVFCFVELDVFVTCWNVCI